MKTYEIFEHTADVGLRVFGRTLEELFRNAAAGFSDLMADAEAIRADSSRPSEEVKVHLVSDNREGLFLDWLRELLYYFSSQRLVVFDIQINKLDEKSIDGVLRGKKFDPRRDDQKCEGKAVTYHQFKMEKTKDGWLAEVIVDI